MGYLLTTSPENAVPPKFWATPKTHTPGPPVKERGARYLSTETGRWIARDPASEHGWILIEPSVNQIWSPLRDPEDDEEDVTLLSILKERLALVEVFDRRSGKNRAAKFREYVRQLEVDIASARLAVSQFSNEMNVNELDSEGGSESQFTGNDPVDRSDVIGLWDGPVGPTMPRGRWGIPSPWHPHVERRPRHPRHHAPSPVPTPPDTGGHYAFPGGTCCEIACTIALAPFVDPIVALLVCAVACAEEAVAPSP